MTLVDLVLMVLVFALVGFLLWLIITYIPMPEPMPRVLIVLVVVVLVLYLLGVITGQAPMPRLR